MAWAQDATTGKLTHSGTTLDAFVLPVDMPVEGKLLFQCLDYTDQVRVRIYADDNASNGWEVGIVPTAGAALVTELTIRRVVSGTAEDPPTGRVAHTLTSGTPYTLEINIEDGHIKPKIVATGITGIELDHTNDTAPTFRLNPRIAVMSDVDGAIVTLVQRQAVIYNSVELSENLVPFGGGDVFACTNDETLELLVPSVFSESANVSAAELGGKLYAVDINTGDARVIDLFARTSVDYDPTYIEAIGGAAGVPGKTKARGVGVYRGRLFWVLRRAVVFAALGDPNSLDTGLQTIDPGAAYAIGSGGSFRFGEDIIGWQVTTDNSLLLLLSNSVFVQLGDPVLGPPEQLPVTVDNGLSGRQAVAAIDVTGRTAFHACDGLVVVANTGGGQNVSRNTLRGPINIARSDRSKYEPIIIRDGRLGQLWLHLTAKDTAKATSRHFVYDEDTGGYAAGGGGWFTQEFDADHDPFYAVDWKGKVVRLCRDGYLRHIDPTEGQDDGVDRPAVLPMQLMDAPGAVGDTVASWIKFQTARWSSRIRVTCYAGDTAEDVYDEDVRETLGSWTTGYNDAPMMRDFSGGALLLVVENAAAGSSLWAVEQVECAVDTMMQATRSSGARVLEAACGVFEAAAAAGTPSAFVPCGVPPNPVDDTEPAPLPTAPPIGGTDVATGIPNQTANSSINQLQSTGYPPNTCSIGPGSGNPPAGYDGTGGVTP